MSQAHIIAVGGLHAVRVFQDCVARLRTLGHAVVVYEDPAAFQQAAANLTPADVVLAAPHFACSRALMAAAPRLRGLVSPVIGVDGFDSPPPRNWASSLPTGRQGRTRTAWRKPPSF